MKRFCFNMIEIILAISILAIGISSVMVLFTSGLKANKSAVSSNALPDIAESAIARIRFLAHFYATEDSWGNYIGNMSNSYEADEPSDPGNNSNEFFIPSSTGYSFLYRQLSPDDSGILQPTFSALVKVKRRSNSVTVVNPRTGGEVTGNIASQVTNRLNNAFAELEMEISYPADIPDAAREKKYYRIELYNSKYNRIGDS